MQASTITITDTRPAAAQATTTAKPLTTSNGTAADELVTAALQRSLTDLIVVASVAKHAHWNVTGPRFRALHLQLDELASVARDAADEIAERIAALGAAPDGRPSSLSTIPEIGAGPIPDAELIETVLVQIDHVVDRAAAAIQTELAADPVSQSIVIDLVAELDKQTWMFAAQR